MHKHLLMLILLFVHAAASAQDNSAATEAAVEKRVSHLTEELRCLVCQNQTIADSHSGLAIDLKNQVREKISAGASDQEVLNYMVERYGDFVLYRPPVKHTTYLLWFGPFLLLFAGFLFLYLRLAKVQKDANLTQNTSDLLSADESERAEKMLRN
ncbi:cytochrome c-type biogenesis protein [Undibacterium sp. Ji22W]|uniref:cytochrome c-type biogenesis protein n=1 Tax=Undibacterium sp. Ji22W TaxID=3413038 RepID=UPI003BF06D59